MKSVKCSDWYRAWGLGNNHIGKLYILEENSYQWKGLRQGRHNNIIQRTHSIFFKVLSDGCFEFDKNNKTNWLPDKRDILEAIRLLNIPNSPKVFKKRKTVYHNQLTINL
jgi:hypothetical protein